MDHCVTNEHQQPCLPSAMRLLAALPSGACYLLYLIDCTVEKHAFDWFTSLI